MAKEYANILAAISCDLCGRKSTPGEYLGDWQRLEYEKGEYDGHRTEYSWYAIDLCPACAARAAEWIEGQRDGL